MPGKVSLVAELCRRLNSSESAMLCAVSHGQVTVDGYVVKPSDDMRWTREQLRGRLAQCNDRAARLFGSARFTWNPDDDATQVEPRGEDDGDL